MNTPSQLSVLGMLQIHIIIVDLSKNLPHFAIPISVRKSRSKCLRWHVTVMLLTLRWAQYLPCQLPVSYPYRRCALRVGITQLYSQHCCRSTMTKLRSRCDLHFAWFPRHQQFNILHSCTRMFEIEFLIFSLYGFLYKILWCRYYFCHRYKPTYSGAALNHRFNFASIAILLERIRPSQTCLGNQSSLSGLSYMIFLLWNWDVCLIANGGITPPLAANNE